MSHTPEETGPEKVLAENPAPATSAAGSQALAVGDRVCLAQAPSYFKTADTMPMLRPPDVVGLEDEGVITEQRAGQTWAVRFQQGAFLLDSPYLKKIDA